MKHYIAYNLHINSQIDLPELLPAQIPDDTPDVTIDIGSIAENGLSNGKQLHKRLWANRDELWLQVPDVARFLVQAGKRILIDPAPNSNEDSIRVFLLGSAFGALLFQRGLLVIHGNAIRIGDQCMICVGDSGAGKSTLAAAFLQRGYDILADDVVPIDQQGYAIPGFPRIKLWQETADHLDIDTSHLRRIIPNMEKFNYPLKEKFCQETLPVRWIYDLNKHEKPSFQFDPIHGAERFQILMKNTYRAHFLEGMGLWQEHLSSCAQLSSRIHISRITRPAKGFELDALVDQILVNISVVSHTD
jgi:hypothetical protein